jgi:hypothetical protein
VSRGRTSLWIHAWNALCQTRAAVTATGMPLSRKYLCRCHSSTRGSCSTSLGIPPRRRVRSEPTHTHTQTPCQRFGRVPHFVEEREDPDKVSLRHNPASVSFGILVLGFDEDGDLERHPCVRSGLGQLLVPEQTLRAQTVSGTRGSVWSMGAFSRRARFCWRVQRSHVDVLSLCLCARVDVNVRRGPSGSRARAGVVDVGRQRDLFVLVDVGRQRCLFVFVHPNGRPTPFGREHLIQIWWRQGAQARFAPPSLEAEPRFVHPCVGWRSRRVHGDKRWNVFGAQRVFEPLRLSSGRDAPMPVVAEPVTTNPLDIRCTAPYAKEFQRGRVGQVQLQWAVRKLQRDGEVLVSRRMASIRKVVACRDAPRNCPQHVSQLFIEWTV